MTQLESTKFMVRKPQEHDRKVQDCRRKSRIDENLDIDFSKLNLQMMGFLPGLGQVTFSAQFGFSVCRFLGEVVFFVSQVQFSQDRFNLLGQVEKYRQNSSVFTLNPKQITRFDWLIFNLSKNDPTQPKKDQPSQKEKKPKNR